MRPLGSSNASDPAKACPEKRMSAGSQRRIAASTSSSDAAGSHARALMGTARDGVHESVTLSKLILCAKKVCSCAASDAHTRVG